MDAFLGSLPAAALALLASFLLGRPARRAGLPQVTVYVFVGALVGPQLLGALGERFPWLAPLAFGEHTHAVLAGIEHLAAGFILFRVGAEFRFTALRRIGPRILLLSTCEIGVTALLVGLAVWVVTHDPLLAGVAPLLATASAPSATLLTLREVEAEGPASRATLLLVGLNNLATLLLFPIPLALLFHTGHPAHALGFSVLALALGSGVGIVTALSLELAATARQRVVLGIVAVLACIGATSVMGEGSGGLAMLATFGAGVMVANGSPHSGALFEELESSVYPLYALFFIAAGADLHLGSLAHLGMLGIAFLSARIAGKLLGTRLGVRLAHWRKELPPQLGEALLCQAGVALGLLAALELSSAEAATRDLRNVVLASVVFFELVGPYLVRRMVVRAGEVKLANLLLAPGAGARGAVREVAEMLLASFGARDLARLHRSGALSARHVMRRVPDFVRPQDRFDRVLRVLGESGSDLLPVVAEDGVLRGVISFQELKDVLYDPTVRNLVIAEDLMGPLPAIVEPQTPLDVVLNHMDRTGAHSWPVVEDGRLAGMLNRRDVYSTLHKALEVTREAEDLDTMAPKEDSR